MGCELLRASTARRVCDNRSMAKIPWWEGFVYAIGSRERAALNETDGEVTSARSWIGSLRRRVDEHAEAIARLQLVLGAVVEVLLEVEARFRHVTPP
jgi:hypothetical protein